METILEQVTIETVDGRTSIFDVVVNPESFDGQRAYVHGSTLYYDMDIFNRGLTKAKSVTRKQIADLFATESSMVRIG